jgi:hypothetical protein
MLALGFTSHGGDQQSEAPPAVRAQRDGAPHTCVIGGRAVDLKSTDGMSQKEPLWEDPMARRGVTVALDND